MSKKSSSKKFSAVAVTFVALALAACGAGSERWARFFGHETGVRYVMTPPIMPPLRSA